MHIHRSSQFCNKIHSQIYFFLPIFPLLKSLRLSASDHLTNTFRKWGLANLSWGGLFGSVAAPTCTLLPTSIRGRQIDRQTDAALLTSLPSRLMRSQHPLNKKTFLQSFLPFLLVCTGDLRRPLEVLPFSLWLTMQGRGGGTPQPSFPGTPLPFSLVLVASCFRPPPTSYPQKSLLGQMDASLDVNERA